MRKSRNDIDSESDVED
jgi:hypothetical protein